MRDHAWWRKLSNRLLVTAGVWGVLMLSAGIFLLRFAALRMVVSVLFAVYFVFLVVTYGVYLHARKLARKAARRAAESLPPLD